MSRQLNRRVAAAEAKIVPNHDLKDKILEFLSAHGYPAVSEALGTLRWPGSGREVGVETILDISVGRDLLGLEDYRGLVPDEILRRAYSRRRNWVVGRHKVRLMAGVIDEQGNVMPGYRMTDNGLIVDT